MQEQWTPIERLWAEAIRARHTERKEIMNWMESINPYENTLEPLCQTPRVSCDHQPDCMDCRQCGDHCTCDEEERQ